MRCTNQVIILMLSYAPFSKGDTGSSSVVRQKAALSSCWVEYDRRARACISSLRSYAVNVSMADTSSICFSVCQILVSWNVKIFSLISGTSYQRQQEDITPMVQNSCFIFHAGAS